ncbi:sensor histidine kinase [Streptomyces sp. ICBB 8177]|nr:sensor histidine kinase [Streptomyces sp. ICBB 8177]
MSVERPLWRALTAFRVLALCYAVARYCHTCGKYAHPLGGWLYLGTLALWTLATLRRTGSALRCTKGFLLAELAVALTGILLTDAFDTHARVVAGDNTLPSIWTAGAVLAFAIKGGWRWAAGASAVVGVSNVVERGALTGGNVHSIVLLFFVSTGIGYVVEVARGSEAALARALRVDAATRERERLARDIHDSVLQVLAMVQRRGGEIGGEAAELGRLAGEQEAALRALVLGAGAPGPPVAATDAGLVGGAADTPAGDLLPDTGLQGPCDLRELIGRHAGPAVTVAAPADPVPLEPRTAAEVAAAVGAALDNVTRHAGPGARAWILVEDEPDAVLVSVRDDGPGIPPGRLADAAAEGRLGVAQSIRGRLRDLGGAAEVVSVPGQGTEVELRVPRRPGSRDAVRRHDRRGRTP